MIQHRVQKISMTIVSSLGNVKNIKSHIWLVYVVIQERSHCFSSDYYFSLEVVVKVVDEEDFKGVGILYL